MPMHFKEKYPMRQTHSFSLLAVAATTILAAGAASAAIRSDLHQTDLARVKRSNVGIAASVLPACSIIAF